MGTSTSSKGPSGNSPLVPPWADIDGQGPGPTPIPQRFKGFRGSLGQFVSSGGEDKAKLRAALHKYATSATGGATVGSRRFGSMAHAGGVLFQTLTAFQNGNNAHNLDLTALQGQDTDVAIDLIIQALIPENGDAERVRMAMNEALSKCLEGVDEFDFSHITDEMLVQVMLVYVGRCIFEQVVLDSKDAFSKAQTPTQAETAEQELLSLVEAATDKHMRPLLTGNISSFNQSQIEQVQLNAIKEVWSEWESYLND